ncbi:hypothetical protein AMS68_007154 [Peltaster fructicola]|uniref:BRCT domain-containing protein n=1 Tax=Peltaster fructicola TaxID=286661 RepID=A0A6H0Y3P2_9PEZI|nr:hypothetical protein AMS68_007154 [Peltaster fructicola]
MITSPSSKTNTRTQPLTLKINDTAMASLAEASIPSMPDADIDALQAQLLKVSNFSARKLPLGRLHAKLTQESLQHGPSEPDATDTVTHDHAPDVASRNSEVPETQDINTSSPKQVYNPSTLKHALSAPSRPSIAMDNRPNAQPGLLATTFHGDLGGDTQVNESQVYRHFHDKTTSNNLTTPHKPLHVIENTTGGKSLEENTYTNVGSASNGEDGSFLDLGLSPGKSDVSEMNSPLASPQSQLQKSATRPGSFPETPQLAGHKRGSDGKVLDSAARHEKTPAYDELFGPAKTPLLTTTQLFQRTQAVSSPLPDGLRSDPVLTRPSPNMQDNAMFTSNFGWTSPNEVRHNPPSSTAYEPREDYISMAESQTRRTQFQGGILHAVSEEQDLFDDPTIRQHNRKHSGRLRHEQARTELKSFNAPARPSSSAMAGSSSVGMRADTTHQHVDGSMSSPQKPRVPLVIDHDAREPIHISDDEESSSDADEHEDAPDDEYNELAQTVVRSSANPQREDELEHHSARSVHEQNAEMHDEETVVSNAEAEIVPGSQPQLDASRVFHATQPTSLGSQVVPQSERRSLLSAAQQHLPSTSSVIPGSQYPSVTSQQLAAQSQVWPRSQQAAKHILTTKKSTTRMGSSPPPLSGALVPEDDQSDEDMIDADSPSIAAKTPATEESVPRSGHNIAAVAEGGLMPRASRHPPVLPMIPTHDVPDAGSPQAYATAPTQPSPTQPRPISHGLPTASQQSIATPLRRAGARRAADIANMPTQRTIDHELSAEMEDAAGVLSELQDYASTASPSKVDARQTVSALDPRSKKRRRLTRTIVSSNPTPPTSSEQGVNGSVELDHQSDLRDVAVETGNLKPTEAQSGDQLAQANLKGDADDDDGADATAREIDQHDRTADKTPDSVKTREAAGSTAVSQLIAARPLRDKQLAKLSGPGKRTYSRKGRPRVIPKTTTHADPQDDHLTKHSALPSDAEVASMHDAIEPPTVEPTTTVEITTVATTPIVDITRPDRVFALFKDSRSMYYPASLTGQSAGAGLVHVRFDDGSESSVKSTQLAPLDLRVGDVFKVDMAHMRNNWVVQSFDIPDKGDSNPPGQDIYGHRSLMALPKGGKRVSHAGATGDPVRISVSDIYLPPTMLMAYTERGLTLPSTTVQLNDRPTTPSRTTTTVSTPKSRSGRQAARKQQYMMPSSSASSEDAVRGRKSWKSGDVFANMVFAVTSSNKPEKESARRECLEEIENNGGTIIDDFEDLFEALSISRRLGLKGNHDDALTLKIKSAYQSLGFVALISDKHCRKTKYTQALALGIPTLSVRWVTDSLDQSRNSASGAPQALPWSRYLLPAGESAYLDGAIRSRTLATYPPNNATFQDIINGRDLLLNGDKVLAVMPRKDKSSLVGKRQSYAFLTLAIGAGDIRPVEDIAEAAKIIMEDDSWTYVMVDSNVREAAEEFEHSSTRGNRRRKSAADSDSVLSLKSKDGRHTIISHEFIMQSLLLGALVV